MPLHEVDIAPLVDGKGRSDSLVYIPLEHSKIHSGEHFFYQVRVPLGTEVSWTIMLTTPPVKTIHLQFNAFSNLETDVAFFEGANYTGGSNLAPLDRNRITKNTPGLVLTSEPTGDTIGTFLWNSGTGSSSGGGVPGGELARGSNELILNKETKYIFQVTSQAANNEIEILLDWYEHEQFVNTYYGNPKPERNP